MIPFLFVIGRGWDGFAYPASDAPYSDLTLTHYLNTATLRDELIGNGRLPLWSGTILSGFPLVANPLNGFWYPFGWPTLLLPLPFAFNLLVGLHLAWGGLGLYLLLRRDGAGPAGAAFAALAFALLPKLFAQFGAGHLTLLYAVPWTPWLLLAAARFQRTWLRILLPGLVLALIFLADVRWAAYAGALWLGWVVYIALRQPPESPVGHRLLKGMGAVLGASLVAILLAACLWLPMLEYTRLSTRSALDPAEIFEISLSPAGLLGLLFPPLLGAAHETILYPGAAVLLLALLAVAAPLRRRLVTFWTLAAVAALLFSLGENLPGFALFGRLPLVNLLRVPPRALFLLGMALAVLAGIALDGMPALAREFVLRRRARLLLAAITAFTLVLAGVIVLVARPERPAPFLWGAAAMLAAALLLAVSVSGRLSPRAAFTGVVILFVLDAGLAGQAMLAYRSWETILQPKENLARFFVRQPGTYRIYSPTFSLLQFQAYESGLELAEGVDPLQFQAYATFMQAATGIPNPGYSVTLPPLAGEIAANAAYTPDPAALGMLGVRYLLAEADLPPVDGLRLVDTIDGTRIYRNDRARPRAWVTPPGADPAGGIFLSAVLVERTPNRLVVEAQGPGLLVLAELLYPGWEAELDGQPTALQSFNGLLRSIELPPGAHQVAFYFRPRSAWWGIAISLAAWLGLGLAGCLLFYFQKRGGGYTGNKAMGQADPRPTG